MKINNYPVLLFVIWHIENETDWLLWFIFSLAVYLHSQSTNK